MLCFFDNFITMQKKIILFLTILGIFFGFQSQAYIDLPNRTLLKGSGPEVYVVEDGIRRWIPNPTIFSAYLFDWNKVKFVTDDVLNNYPKGANVSNTFINGTLVKSDKNPRVYVWDNTKFRWISDPYIFSSNNFSWGDIIIVPDAKMAAWGLKRTTSSADDLKAGEFVNTPTAFLLTKPASEVRNSEVTFVYSGTNPTGPASELVWETYLEGYDKTWVPTSTTYTRTIKLPELNRSYTFYVRSKNKAGRVDRKPVSYMFTVTGFSSSFEPETDLRITNRKVNSNNILNGFLVVTNYSSKRVNVTGMSIKNKNNEVFYIPQAAKYFYSASGNYLEDIILESNQSLTIYSGSSPIGSSYQLNKCMGYLNNYYTFSPKLPNECPKPLAQDIANLSGNCRDYIKTLPICAAPDTSNLKITQDSTCTTYLINTFNYASCAAIYRLYPDFLKNSWHAYLNRSNFMNNISDEIYLLDKGGGLIDKIKF